MIVAIYFAIRTHQWNRLIGLAAELSFTAAKMADLDNASKRAVVANRLYQRANPLAQQLFSREQMELAVETAYQLITKPRLQEGSR
ncbi:hypothetical protein D3C87_1885080 [compost metagenome]